MDGFHVMPNGFSTRARAYLYARLTFSAHVKHRVFQSADGRWHLQLVTRKQG